MKGLLCLLLVLIGLTLLVSFAEPGREEVEGYWLDQDGRVTEFRRRPNSSWHTTDRPLVSSEQELSP